MRKSIRGSLFLRFAFLIAPDLAAAECSWVLWSNYGTLDPMVPLALSIVNGAPSPGSRGRRNVTLLNYE